MNSTWINFSNLPESLGGFSKLFVDYVNEFPKVHQFFESDFHHFSNLPKYFHHIRTNYQHRAAVVEILREQNEGFGARERVLENIERLANERTFAVVTGQQVGILGGPLYTLYKSITAIKLCKRLATQFPEYTFVPVFWLEGEDHDFEEMNHVNVLSQEHVPTRIQYSLNGKMDEKNVTAVGEIVFDSHLRQFFEELKQHLHQSEFTQPLFEMLQQTYTPSKTFVHAFVSLLGKYFEEDGLIFISSNDRRLKTLLSPVFQKEISEYPRISQMIIKRSAELEGDYHAQIKTKALNLFLFHKNGRYLIEPRQNDFSLKGTRHYLSKEELLKIATESPELLSPNVALRPICQDTLLPTVAYVGGPSEIAYFAQLKPVYEDFHLMMPVIYPRASATVIDERTERALEKYELDIVDCFHDPVKVGRKAIEMLSEIKIDDMFGDAEKRTEELLNEMRFGLQYIDPTLIGPLETTREKMVGHLQVLKEKVKVAQERKHETALRQITKSLNLLFPNASFQERELNILYFLNKYGMTFLQQVKESLEIEAFKHQVLHIG